MKKDVRVLLPHFQPIAAETSLAPYASTRSTALSALLSNVSKVQLKQGTIKASRLSSDTSAFWSAREAQIDAAHPAERYFGAAENGCYLVAPPSSESEGFKNTVVPMTTISSIDQNNVLAISIARHVPIVNPDTDTPFLLAVVVEETVVDETQIAITVDHHLEFRTTSPLFQVGISAVPLEMYHSAQLVIAQAGYIFENETHWKDLAMRVARIAATVIPALFPGGTAARVAGAANLLLNAVPKEHDLTQKQMVKPRQRRRQQKKVTVQQIGRAHV